jgi:hypothetical protein
VSPNRRVAIDGDDDKEELCGVVKSLFEEEVVIS